MATRDAQDILDVKRTEARGPKKKAPKQKLVRPSHISKEVWLLETQGDRTPPVSLTLQQPKKPAFKRKVRPWEWQPFTNPQRTDGLVLRHWRKRNVNPVDTQETGPATPVEGASNEAYQDKAVKAEAQPDYAWAKYNTKVDVPKYTDEEYSARLQSDEWSKEETDYLMGLVEDFDLRWVVIADRYDFQPTSSETSDENAMALAPVTKPRSMEDMKARYYKITAEMMEIRTGLSNMTTAEFSLHEKMLKFDPAKETKRKDMAGKLMYRTDEEIEEEKRLLIELKRIIQDEDNFIRERTELFERLNAPSGRAPIAQFEGSAGLMKLLKELIEQDKNRSRHLHQRRAIAGIEDPTTKVPNTPATPLTATGRGSDARRSLDGAAGASERRKESKASQMHMPSSLNKKLTENDERKFGLSRPDKLLTGEKIRHLRIEKRVTARASSVAAKVQDSMVELGIPIKPVMATGRAVMGYEELCNNLDALLDLRRHSEKTENEVKVLKAKNDLKDGKEPDGDVDGEVKGEPDGDLEEKAREDGAEADRSLEDEEPESRRDDDDEDDDEDKAEHIDEDEDEEMVTKSDEEEEEDEDAVGDDDEDDEDTPAADVTIVDDDDEEEEDDGDVGKEDESRPSTRHSGRSGPRKRSVSVLSSAPSQKSTKRQRK